jgi:hypothetical protein
MTSLCFVPLAVCGCYRGLGEIKLSARGGPALATLHHRHSSLYSSHRLHRVSFVVTAGFRGVLPISGDQYLRGPRRCVRSSGSDEIAKVITSKNLLWGDTITNDGQLNST